MVHAFRIILFFFNLFFSSDVWEAPPSSRLGCSTSYRNHAGSIHQKVLVDLVHVRFMALVFMNYANLSSVVMLGPIGYFRNATKFNAYVFLKCLDLYRITILILGWLALCKWLDKNNRFKKAWLNQILCLLLLILYEI